MKITTVNNKNIKATIAFFITVLLIVFIAFIFKYNFASAGAGESVRGFAWGGTESLGGYQGFGWISLNSITDGSPVSYGVNVPAGDGNLSGHAWSEHYGWISFNGADLAGCLPVLTQAKVTLSGAVRNVTGGARITAIRDAGGNAGGFDGCISLSGSSYQVTAVNSGLGYDLLQGYAWSGDLGWIDFNVSGSPVPVSLPAPTGFTFNPIVCNAGAITLKWDSVPGATSYILKENGIELYNGPLLTFTHVVANDGWNHNYTVMATKGSDSSAAASVSAIAPMSCSAVPAVPAITATPDACDSNTINVTWSSVAGVTYKIKVDGAELPLAGNNYSHTSLTPGTTHNYSVMATNINGNSAYSASRTAVAPAACGSPLPSGSITASSCTIPAGDSSCSSNVSWNSSDFTGGASVRQDGTQFSTVDDDSETRSVNPDNDNFTLVDTGSSGFTVSANANATCASGSWDSSSGTCVLAVVAPPAASITLKALPSLVRSGNTTNVEVIIDSANPTTCKLYGVNGLPTISHPGTALNPIGTYSPYITKALTGAQIVTINCTIDGAIPAVDSSATMRINVVPTVQEI